MVLRIVRILPLPLTIQLINLLLPTCQHLERATLIIVITRLRHQEIRRDGPSHHESAHDLQHCAEMVLLPLELVLLLLVLVASFIRFESVGEEDLDEPRSKLARGGRDAVACAAVACGEDLGGNLEIRLVSVYAYGWVDLR
jgi:hypothetical protein